MNQCTFTPRALVATHTEAKGSKERIRGVSPALLPTDELQTISHMKLHRIVIAKSPTRRDERLSGRRDRNGAASEQLDVRGKRTIRLRIRDSDGPTTS